LFVHDFASFNLRHRFFGRQFFDRRFVPKNFFKNYNEKIDVKENVQYAFNPLKGKVWVVSGYKRD